MWRVRYVYESRPTRDGHFTNNRCNMNRNTLGRRDNFLYIYIYV